MQTHSLRLHTIVSVQLNLKATFWVKLGGTAYQLRILFLSLGGGGVDGILQISNLQISRFNVFIPMCGTRHVWGSGGLFQPVYKGFFWAKVLPDLPSHPPPPLLKIPASSLDLKKMGLTRQS